MSKLIPMVDDKEKWKTYFLKSLKPIKNSQQELTNCIKTPTVSASDQVVKRAKKVLTPTRKRIKARTLKQKVRIKGERKTKTGVIKQKKNISKSPTIFSKHVSARRK